MILAICWSIGCLAQKKSSSAESYSKYRSRNAKSAEQLLNEAAKLKEKDPVGALDKLEEAVAVSVAQEDVINEGRSYLMLGEINENAGEWARSLDYFSRALEKFVTARSADREIGLALRGRIRANIQLGDADAALNDCTRALGLSLPVDERRERELDLGEIYYRKGELAEALKVVEAIIPDKVVNATFESRLQSLRARIYARQNNPQQTQAAFNQSLNSLNTTDSVDAAGMASTSKAKEEIANVFREQRRYDDEIELRNQSIEFNLDNRNLTEVTKDKVELSAALSAKGENSAALRELEEAAAIADTLDEPAEKANAYLSLANLYERNGRTREALQSFRKYSEAIAAEKTARDSADARRNELRRRQNEIELLTRDLYLGQSEQTIREATVERQQLIIYGLLFLVAITGVTSFFIYRNAQASKLANRLLALKSLRSQMNPHFIFNALNSVNQFISTQDERTANRFLSEFSQLMRLVLENSQEDFISLRQEQEILSLYLKLEHYRFRDKFEYSITVADDVDPELIQIPPMLIQPYIENAVWHGLRYKDSKGHLSLIYEKKGTHLVVTVADDGIGRKRSAELKTANQRKHQSTGLKNIHERLQIINQVYHTDYRVTIGDAPAGTGTVVRLFIPIDNRKNQE